MLDYLVVGGLLTVIAFCLFILTRIQPEPPQQHQLPREGETTLVPAQTAPSPTAAPRPQPRPTRPPVPPSLKRPPFRSAG